MPWELMCVTGYLALASVPLVVTDARSHRLPNAWVVPGIVIAIAAVTIYGITRQQWPWQALLCGMGYAALCLLLHFLGGMGMGDVKLALALGLAAGMLGWQVGLMAVILAFLSGGVVALVLLTLGKISKRRVNRRIAFGPFMLLGFWCAVFAALV